MDRVHDQSSRRSRLVSELIRDACRLSFARSGGPGGQNVNKVASKVIARLPVASLSALGVEEARRVESKLANRINAEGEIVVAAQDSRDQARNRQIALARLTDLVTKALARPKARHKTKPTASAREARIRAKKRRSESKRLRERVDGAD